MAVAGSRGHGRDCPHAESARRVPRPPDPRHVRPRRHVGPQLLRPLLLQHALEQRRAVRDHRARPVPEPRRDRRVHHRVDRPASSTPCARRASSAATAWTRRSARCRLEVIEGLKTLRIRCDDNEWGIDADLTFTGVVAALEEPRTFSPPVRPRHPGRHALRAGRRVGGHAHRRGPHVRRHARPVEGRARPLVGRPPGRRARGTRHQGARAPGRLRVPPRLAARCSSTTTCSRSRSTRTPTATGIVEESVRVWNLDQDRPVEHLGRTRGRHRLHPRHARDARRAVVRTTDPDGKPDRRDEHAAAHALPRRRLRLRHRRRSGATASTRAR